MATPHPSRCGCTHSSRGSVVDFFAGFIVDTEEINDVATAIKVYPNPSSAVATLSFNLKEAAVVSVDVVNMLGQQVATVLPSTTLAAGTYQLDWLTKTSLPNGLYQFRIMVGGQLTQKAITVNR
ncbi:MAG: T9SS type A sorting domain-containing protein [Bacteroidota bacterium]